MTLVFYFYPSDFLTHRKLSEPLYIEQLSNYYIDLLSEMPGYCCPVEIFYFVFWFIFSGVIEI